MILVFNQHCNPEKNGESLLTCLCLLVQYLERFGKSPSHRYLAGLFSIVPDMGGDMMSDSSRKCMMSSTLRSEIDREDPFLKDENDSWILQSPFDVMEI